MENKFEETLIKIKNKVNKFYENIGRFGEVTDSEMEELIADIDDLLNNANLNKSTGTT